MQAHFIYLLGHWVVFGIWQRVRVNEWIFVSKIILFQQKFKILVLHLWLLADTSFWLALSFHSSLPWLVPCRRSLADGPPSQWHLAFKWHLRQPISMEALWLDPPTFSLFFSHSRTFVWLSLPIWCLPFLFVNFKLTNHMSTFVLITLPYS